MKRSIKELAVETVAWMERALLKIEYTRDRSGEDKMEKDKNPTPLKSFLFFYIKLYTHLSLIGILSITFFSCESFHLKFRKSLNYF